MSPLPSSLSAPISSSTTRLSVRLATWKAMRAGRFDLIRPVITSTVGFCVASTRWMPTARLFCARRMMCPSTSLAAVIIRSANYTCPVRTGSRRRRRHRPRGA